jgi:hypothetical protein
VDNHVIAHTDLTRVYHQAGYIDGNPVVRADRPWEEAGTDTACAMPYGDGVAFDPKDRLFKLWYMGGLQQRQTCLAVSTDALHWEKPDWGVVAETNIVWPYHRTRGRDSQTVLVDPHDAMHRYKMQSSGSDARSHRQWLLGSPDGVHWSFLHETPPTGDRTTMFYNPFRRKWVFSIRAGGEVGEAPRHRLVVESDTFVPSAWAPVYWTHADGLDPFPRGANGNPPQLYCLDCVAYENLLLGLFTIFRGDVKHQPKLNDICVGFSRDGFRWHRPDRRPFIGLGGAGQWNYGNVQPAGGCCVVIGDALAFFVSGRRGIAGTDQHGECSTGVAMLRRDGFASLQGSGSLTTHPVVFDGVHLFVNADVAGELRAEVLDRDYAVVLPAAACAPVTGDSTRHRVVFVDATRFAAVRGTPVRLRFHVDRGKLYSFWTAPSIEGRSGGYLAAGSPDANFEGRDYNHS